MMKNNKNALATLLAALVITPVQADERAPAVSAPNLKADLAGGVSDGKAAGITGISGTLPLGRSFGVQVDGAFGRVDDHNMGGAATHLFWRDPDTMLFGITGMASRVEDAADNLYRSGVETEFYLDDFTLAAAFGGQWDYKGSTGYADFGVTYYITPDFTFTSRASGFSDTRTIQVGSEYRPGGLGGTSFYVDLGTDNDDNEFAMFGVRFSLGGEGKTLKERDRFDDPINIVSSLMSASAEAVKEQTGALAAVTPPKTTVAAGGGGGGGCGGGLCC